MDHVEFGKIVKSEETVGKADHKQARRSVEGGAVDFGVVLHEEILFGNSPLGFTDNLISFRVLLFRVCPAEQGTVLADCIDL